ncbi:MAG TPA: LPS export ABC transporter ATP-binding protein [Candidatus Sulfotelmatobacter sp.]|nr:LPS export ABC transporter ATP-binding protein [Candidatus Sulfotelmatobacter sp.]
MTKRRSDRPRKAPAKPRADAADGPPLADGALDTKPTLPLMPAPPAAASTPEPAPVSVPAAAPDAPTPPPSSSAPMPPAAGSAPVSAMTPAPVAPPVAAAPVKPTPVKPALAAATPPLAAKAPAAARPTGPKLVDIRPVVRATEGTPGETVGPRLVADNPGLVALNLGKQFKKRPVVRDVSINVERGEAVGLLGPNGAGKTTCFYMMIGLIAPDYGTVLLDGHDITALPMYRRARLGIGYLPQEASIFRGMTVEGNIRSVLEVVEPDRDRRETLLDELLAEFSIDHLRRTSALALSGGERRRVEIARALASQPAFILLDEPLAGIDPIAVGDIRDLVSHLKDRGIGVLITDHNVRETLDIVDRAYIMHEGSVLMEGAPSEIVAHKDVRRVYLGERFSL